MLTLEIKVNKAKINYMVYEILYSFTSYKQHFLKFIFSLQSFNNNSKFKFIITNNAISGNYKYNNI